MTDTPLTDAHVRQLADGVAHPHWVAFACKLERDNADLRAKLAYLDGRTNWLCTCGGTDCNGQRENEELLTVLQILARHSCHTYKAECDYNGQVAGTEVTNSQAVAANAMALCRLAEAGLFRIVAESGRMVVGYWPENDPQKQKAQP